MVKRGLFTASLVRAAMAGALSLLMAWPSLLMFSAILWLAPAAINPAWAAPQDGKVVSGQAGIGQDGKTTTITQTSDRVSINWRSFGIAADETVQFKQPSAGAIALNRVIGNDPSQIFGRLNANGRVYLINPNGILFGSGAQVNVGGLVASTLDIDDDSLNKNKRRFAGNSKASVTVEQGARLVADGSSSGGGEVALLGHQVINQGTILARLGTVALGGGNDITLDFNGDRLLSLVVNQNELNAQARNGGLIQADGGMVLMSAGARDSLLASVVNNNGILQAQSVQEREGKIVLLAGMAAGSTEVSGTLDASAPLADGSNGGFIETSGAQVKVADGARISTRAASGKAGLWLIDPTHFSIAASGGDMTGTTLAAQLANSNVEIQSTNGGSGTSGNIYVNDALRWSSGTGLTLNAINNIYLNSLIDASQGNGGRLVLKFGQGNANGTVTDSSGNPTTTLADYYLGANGKVNLQSGSNFSIVLGNAGIQRDFNVITTLNELRGSGSSDFALGSDIDASETRISNFDPLRLDEDKFADGLGHHVDKLTIDKNSDKVGLFGVIDHQSKLSNWRLVDASVTGRNQVGALVGFNQGGSITGSSASGTVSGVNNVGGLVGNNSGPVSSSDAKVSVVGTGDRVGGLAGSNIDLITDSYATGAVRGSGSDVGELVGYKSFGIITNSYYSLDSSSINGATPRWSLQGLSDALLPRWKSNAYALDGGWFFNQSGDGYFAIDTATKLRDAAYFATRGDYKFRLTADIDAGSGSLPENFYFSRFSAAEFDGGGFKLSHYRLNLPDADSVGLFGVLGAGSKLSNWKLVDASVTGRNQVGALVGDNEGGSITGSSASGTVSGVNYVGGLVGANLGQITDSYATGAVSGVGNVGGLVGLNARPSATVSDSYAMGPVTGSGSGVGGLVGANRDGSTIQNSYATGAVTGFGTDVGALVGDNNASITNSYYSLDSSSINGATPRWSVKGLSDALLTRWKSNAYVLDGGWFFNQSGDGYFAIDTATKLRDAAYFATRGDYKFRLTADIDAGSGSLPENFYFSRFSAAEFDGGGFKLSHYRLNLPDADSVGLFGVLGAGSKLSNWKLVDASVTGRNQVGALVGDNEGGSITGSSASGTVSGVNNVGGLVGRNQGQITDSYATSAVSGGSSVGGLVGYSLGAVSGSYATGSVTGSGSGVGGLVGANRDGATIQNSYATGAVTGFGTDVGALVGDNNASITNSYYSLDSSSINGATPRWSLQGLSDALLPRWKSNAYALDGGWFFNQSGDGYFAIDTATKLRDAAYFATRGDYKFRLTADIDAGSGSLPENFYFSRFSAAEFDGGGFRLSHYRLNLPDADSLGLFGVLGAGSKLSNWRLVDASVTGINQVGALVGYNEGGSITGSSASGAVSGVNNVGGLVGYSVGAVSGSYATGSVVGTGNQVGGLVGLNAGQITDSYATGAVSGSSNVGGLVGYSVGAVSGSYATGSVVGTGNQVGGLVGLNAGQITDSYATGAVSGGSNVGGLVGGNQGQITDSYATSAVSGGSNVGGLVGYSVGAVSGSYATGSVVATGDRIGGLVGGNQGQITDSYATGAVSGGSNVGGLVGNNTDASATVSDSYATGSVTGSGYGVGGLVGANRDGATIRNSYATGAVTGLGTGVGALVGDNNASITNSYYSLDSSGTNPAVGSSSLQYRAGLSNDDFKRSSAFGGFDFSSADSPWVQYEGYTAPLLRSFMKTLGLTGGSKVYNGKNDIDVNSLQGETASGSIDRSKLLGSVLLDGKDAGEYQRLSGLYSDQQGYWITYAPNFKFTINKADYTTTSLTGSKTYNGDANFAGLRLEGVNGETFSANGVANSKNVWEASQFTSVTDITGNNGADSRNYNSLSLAGLGTNNRATITRAAYTTTSLTGSKTYNGDANIGGLRLDGVNGESFVANGVANSKNVWEAKQFTSVSGITGNNGADSRNYNSLNLADLGTNQATISAAKYASLKGSKTYDGTARFSNVRLQGVGEEFFTLDEATSEVTTVGAANRFVAVSGAPRSANFDRRNYQSLDLGDVALVNQASITAIPVSSDVRAANTFERPVLPLLNPMGPVVFSNIGAAPLPGLASGSVTQSDSLDTQTASRVRGLQVIGSGIRLPDRAATMLSDQDFE